VRLVARVLGALIGLSLALSWLGTWLMFVHEDVLIRLGLPIGCVSMGPDTLAWARQCAGLAGPAMLAMLAIGYGLGRMRPRWASLAAAYVLPLGVALLLDVWFRSAVGHWAERTEWANAWGGALWAYGAGYLLAAPWGLTPNVEKGPPPTDNDAGDPPACGERSRTVAPTGPDT